MFYRAHAEIVVNRTVAVNRLPSGYEKYRPVSGDCGRTGQCSKQIFFEHRSIAGCGGIVIYRIIPPHFRYPNAFAVL